MAADVRAALRPADGPARRVQTPLAPRDTRHATRVDNFYLYSLEANMAYLAAISTPIAVQCEKLIGGRYSLFDYVVRAAVKACASEPEWLAGDAAAELLMVLDKGKNTSSLKTPPARRFTTSPWNAWPPRGGPAPRGQRRAQHPSLRQRRERGSPARRAAGNAPQHHQHRRHHAENGH